MDYSCYCKYAKYVTSSTTAYQTAFHPVLISFLQASLKQRYVFVPGYGMLIQLRTIDIAQININNVPDTNSPSSFGQTLPLVMLIVPITDVWNDNYPLLEAKLLKHRVAHRNSDHIPLVASRVSHSSHGSRSSRSKYLSVDSQIYTSKFVNIMHGQFKTVTCTDSRKGVVYAMGAYECPHRLFQASQLQVGILSEY